MNVSMMDTFNLGWKLVAVLQGRSAPSLLHTYSSERQPMGAGLIEFDRAWAKFLVQPVLDPEHPERGGVTAQEIHDEYAKNIRFTAGLLTHYPPSLLTGTAGHQGLAAGFEIGTRFHSQIVTRVCDGRVLHLGHAHLADARWRIYAFGDADGAGLISWAQWLTDDPASPVRQFTPRGWDIDAVFDVHGIFRAPHQSIGVTDLPGILLPTSGPLGLQDWEKVWAVNDGVDIFATRGIASAGAIVVVRPDQYVAHVLPLSARTELTDFFAPFMRVLGA
jgi:phenol 2-monooxygenase